MTFFYKNAINIFTDASIARYHNNKFISSSGYIAVYNGQILSKDYKIFSESTNNYGELYAIKMGVEYAMEVGRETDLFLNIISDSLISINSIRKWIFEWKYSQSNPLLLLTKQGNIVSNQDIILTIVQNIIYSGIHINFYHILGHKNSSDIGSIFKVKEDFKKNNNLEDTTIPDEIISEMIDYNNMIDEYSRSQLYTIVKNKKYNSEEYQKYTFPYIWKPNVYDMELYRKLIS